MPRGLVCGPRGDHDGAVGIDRAEASRDALARLGYAVQWHAYPMPHSVHPQEIADIGDFLRSVIGERQA